MRRLPPLKSLSVKLGLVLFVVVAGAMAIVYVAVVPRLESRLVNSTFESLERSIPVVSVGIRSNSPFQYQVVAETFERQLDARVVVFRVLSAGDAPIPVADSSGIDSNDVVRDPFAVEAARGGRQAKGRVERDELEFAEVAAPVEGVRGTVVLLSAPLADRLSTVGVVRRDLIIFGAVALVVSWLVGALAAVKLTRRIHRLETASDRIADGGFDAEIRDTSQDELGHLARTFDRMRVRLSDLDRARREFIANASHELRTPLFALGGFLELLADEDVDERTRRDFLETARGQVERLTRLATDLLDLSRIDAGQIGLESEPVDLAELARSLADEFGPLAETTGHTLRAGASGDVHALGDAERVLQIGRSLVENALRHTPTGTEIELRATVWVDRAELAVHDDGPGIVADDQERVFERFYRGEGSAAFGSGIGLTIARELAQRMGGTLALRSEPGSTTFTLTLPRAVAPAPFPRENALVSP